MGAGIAALALAAALFAAHPLTMGAFWYRKALTRAGLPPNTIPEQMRAEMHHVIAVTVVAAIVAAALSDLVRRRIRGIPFILLVATVAACFALGFAVITDPRGIHADDMAPEAVLHRQANLVPQWFAPVNILLMACLVAATAAALILTSRIPAREFYRGRDTGPMLRTNIYQDHTGERP